MHNSWAPFHSVINGEIIANEVLKEKSKINKPILSDEQIMNIESLILESFTNQIIIIFTLFKKGYVYNLEGIVIKITKTESKIILNNKKVIYFQEIISIQKKE